MNKRKAKRLSWLGLPAVLIILYLAGPEVDAPQQLRDIPAVTSDLRRLEQTVSRHEDSIPYIKPDNEARIVWAGEPYRKTSYALVYLHGWSASQAEGAPVHTDLGKRYGMNVFLPRLYGHGLEESHAMEGLTADKYLASAREAIAVASELGDSLIIFGTSTGGSLALYLAPAVNSLTAIVLYSPNIEIYEPTAALLDDPWGYQIARLVRGSDYHSWDIEAERKPYWSNKYPLKALTHLQSLVATTMTEETFRQVRVPLFLGYYYKDESRQDHTVSVPAMLRMFDQVSTPASKKVSQAFPEAGEHVIGSYLVSKDLPAVWRATVQFMEGTLGLSPVSADSSFMRGTSHSE